MSINVAKRNDEIKRTIEQLNELVEPLLKEGYDLLVSFENLSTHDYIYTFNLTLLDKNGKFYERRFSFQIYTLFKHYHRQPKRYGVAFNKKCGWLIMPFIVYTQKYITVLFEGVLNAATNFHFTNKIHISFVS